MAKNLRPQRPWAEGKPNAIVLRKEHNKIMIPTEILPCDQGITQPSSKKRPPSIVENGYRDPQLEGVQRVRDLGALRPTWGSVSTSDPSPGAQGAMWKWRRKECKNQRG